ncbi:hypothetical protein SAMN05444920_106433 [Nonomuraea solani]|uniref:Uncharacterized protein n=1 Tax=Nonomuraea solani TaxID=1144553 RepID=A0A1H6DVG1_9ACTN|nr:hypothetical protein SAMN05444920_106433 [Nonomuraea solani]
MVLGYRLFRMLEQGGAFRVFSMAILAATSAA